MNTTASPSLELPIARSVKVGRFFFASVGGAYRFTLNPLNSGYELYAEWCEGVDDEASDAGYDFHGGYLVCDTPQEALATMNDWLAKAALEEKHALTQAGAS